MRTRRCLLGALALLAWAAGGCADQRAADAPAITVSVETDYAVAVPGESITLLWRFAVAPDWHLYWVGRNDSGFAPTVTLDLPPGWIAGGLQWPAPERHLSDGDILDHVYYDELVLLQKVGVPADAPTAGEVAFTASIEWLACRDSCVPGKAVLPVRLPAAAHHTGPRSEAWAAAHDALPQALPDGLLTAVWEGQTFRLAGAPGTGLVFMPTTDCGELVNLIADGVGESLALRFQVEDGTVGPVRGLVRVMAPGGPPRTYTIDFPARSL